LGLLWSKPFLTSMAANWKKSHESVKAYADARARATQQAFPR
jgi:hypothetical protein